MDSGDATTSLTWRVCKEMKSRPGQGLTEISKKIRHKQNDHASRRTQRSPHTPREQHPLHTPAPPPPPRAAPRPPSPRAAPRPKPPAGYSPLPRKSHNRSSVEYGTLKRNQ